MTTKTISVAEDFSPSPAGRYPEDGPFPGATFRDKFLLPALRECEDVVVQLDGTSGLGSSFLEEAFGGLVRAGLSEGELKRRLHLQSSRPTYVERIWNYIGRARATTGV